MQPVNGRIHLDFLDGLRGIAALYVLLFHVVVDGKEELIRENSFLNFFRFGHEAVVVFIVLSGFVLALPVARSADLRLNGGLKKFFYRRAKRILPGYYAALFLFPVYILAVEILKRLIGEQTNWDRIGDLFISGDMFSHLLIVHNISSQWEGSINPVLWSLGTEWWIYFVFALILLPLWRRAGIVSAIVTGFLLGLIPTILLILGLPTLYGFPHLIMGFCLGMGIAALLYSQSYKNHQQVWSLASNIVIVLAMLIFYLLVVYEPAVRLKLQSRFVTDFLLAVVCSGVIFKISQAEIVGISKSKLLFFTKRFLETRPVTTLGKFSYSLYLTHLVLWNMIGTTLRLAPVKAALNLSLDPMPMRLLVLIPGLLILAYGFYLLFESPFLQRNTERMDGSNTEKRTIRLKDRSSNEGA